MTSKFAKLAAASVLSFCTAASALAGSVTQPGETVGLASGAPLPEGLYFVNTRDWATEPEIRPARPSASTFRSSLGRPRGRSSGAECSS